MDILLLVAHMMLAGVLGVAGIAKLADPTGSRQALIDFGVPALLATLLGVLLPLAELAVAGLLVAPSTAWGGAIGALGLFLLFLVGLSLTLAQGRAPACHCFGQLSSTPIGWPTLVRTALFAALSGLLVWQGPPIGGLSALSGLAMLSRGQLVGLGVVVVLSGLLAAHSWIVFHLLGQHGRLLLRLEALESRLAAHGLALQPTPPSFGLGLAMGTPAPLFRLQGIYGETLTLEALRAPGKPVLLVFTDPGCGPCLALLPDLGRWQREHGAGLTLAMISRGTAEANLLKTTEHGIPHVLLQNDREVAQAYQAYGTPSAVVVSADGTIGSPLAQGADQIQVLVAQTLGTPLSLPPLAPLPAPTSLANGRCPHCGQVHAPHGNGHGAALPQSLPEAIPIGAPAPAVQLPDLTGRLIDLVAFRGSPTLLLFWNPGCGFCQQLLPDLQAWEAQSPPGTPTLLVVSTGTVEANQSLGLRAPVVLDDGFSLGRTLGANGTPSAILLDAEGRIASPVAVGAPAVLALARGDSAHGGSTVVGSNHSLRKADGQLPANGNQGLHEGGAHGHAI